MFLEAEWLNSLCNPRMTLPWEWQPTVALSTRLGVLGIPILCKKYRTFLENCWSLVYNVSLEMKCFCYREGTSSPLEARRKLEQAKVEWSLLHHTLLSELLQKVLPTIEAYQTVQGNWDSSSVAAPCIGDFICGKTTLKPIITTHNTLITTNSASYPLPFHSFQFFITVQTLGYTDTQHTDVPSKRPMHSVSHISEYMGFLFSVIFHIQMYFMFSKLLTSIFLA